LVTTRDIYTIIKCKQSAIVKCLYEELLSVSMFIIEVLMSLGFGLFYFLIIISF